MSNLKVALVTGANAGLGLETVRQLALSSSFGTVFLGVRSQAKGDGAIAALEKQGCDASKLKVLVVDVSSVAGTREACDAFIEKLARDGATLDLLVANAGRLGGTRVERTSEGLEAIFAASLAGHVVMTLKFINSGAVFSQGAAIVLAGSESATGVVGGFPLVKLEVLQGKMGEGASLEDVLKVVARADSPLKWSAFSQYPTVKACTAWWTAELARQLAATGSSQLRVFTISPGNVPSTGVASSLPTHTRFALALLKPLMYAFGYGHAMATGASRYLEALEMTTAENGEMFASTKGKLVGPLTNNNKIFAHLADREKQAAAFAAINDLVGETLTL